MFDIDAILAKSDLLCYNIFVEVACKRFLFF